MLGLLATAAVGLGTVSCATAPEPAPATAPPTAGPTPTASPTPTVSPPRRPSTRPPTASPPSRPTPAPEPAGRQTAAVPLRPPTFANPRTLADALVVAETAVRDAGTSADELRRHAWAQQQAYRDLAVRASWRDRVRSALPRRLGEAFDANLAATVQLRRLTDPRPELPPWRIVEPPPAEELRSYYRSAEETFGVGWEYLAAIHLVESRMGRIRGVSTAGARGPMQFLPSTWAAYGRGDIDDPRDSIFAAARYLTAHGAPGDMSDALYAYNNSSLYVDAITAHARVMRTDPAAYRSYYHWRVYYRMTTGEVVLPVGWSR